MLPPGMQRETPDLHGAYPRLSEAQVARLATVGQRRPVRRGQILAREGEVADTFYVLLRGQAVVLSGYPGDPQVIRVHGPGRFLGELSVLTGQVEFVTTAVNLPGEVLAIDVRTVRDLVRRDPDFGELILRAYVVRRSMLISQGAGPHIVGSRYSPDTHRLRDFLARNRIPHRFVDIDRDAGADVLVGRLRIASTDLPIVILNAGEVLRNPTNPGLAARIGLSSPPLPDACHDLAVIGAGPAGLAAAVYGASEGLSTAVLDSVAAGGQAALSSRIENYLGFPAGISGAELAERAVIQAAKFGARMSVPGTAVALQRYEDGYVVRTDGCPDVVARSVVLATGAKYRKLDVPRLAEFEMTSVYYAATRLEAAQCVTHPVAVVGGGNSAGQAALFLAQYCPRVYLLILHGDLGRDMSYYLVEQLELHPRIRVLAHTAVCELIGDRALEAVRIEDTGTRESRRLDVRALFVFIGATPCTSWLEKDIALDDKGFVLTGDHLSETPDRRYLLETSWPAVFAAGDVRSGSIKRVASAAGEGAMAVRFVHERLTGVLRRVHRAPRRAMDTAESS